MYDCSSDGAYIIMGDAIWNGMQTYASTIPGPSKSRSTAETVLTLPWTMLFEIVCERTHDPLHDYHFFWLLLGRCNSLWCHGRCYSKSVAKVRMIQPGTIKIYDFYYTWDCACMVIDDAIWNRLKTYAAPTPDPSKAMIVAETMPTLSLTMLFKIVCNCKHDQMQAHHNLCL